MNKHFSWKLGNSKALKRFVFNDLFIRRDPALQHPQKINLNEWLIILIWSFNLRRLLFVWKGFAIKNNLRKDQGWKMYVVCCIWSLVGRKNMAWLGQHYSSPLTQSMSWRLNVSRKMADKEEWEEMKQAAFVSTGSSSSQWHPFTFLHHRAKKVFVCLCVHGCVWLVIPIRGFVFFLHYLSSFSSQQFYFKTII